MSCGGQLVVRRGPLLAGEVAAMGGVCSHTLGSQAGVRTVVEAGVDGVLRESLQDRVAKVWDKQQRAAKIRQLVEPLMSNQKSLTAQQKEKATELLYDASELEQRAMPDLKALQEQYASIQPRSKAEIFVKHILHPGVIIRFAGVEAITTTAMRGPLYIIPREVDGQLRIVISSDKCRPTAVLESRIIADDPMLMLQKLARNAA